MKKTIYLFTGILVVLFSVNVNAATSISKYVQVADVADGVESMTFTGVRAASWVSESMGFLGWTHFSKWGFMNLKKDQVVTMTLDATQNTGFHPAISVWHRDINTPATNSSLYYMDDHFYKQTSSVSDKNAINNDDSANPVPIGKFVRTFVANAYDGDVLGDYIYGSLTSGGTVTQKFGPYMPEGYNTKDIASADKLFDGVSGKVVLTFTAPKTAVYQFVIGGLKPDIGSAAASLGMTGGTVLVDIKVK